MYEVTCFHCGNIAHITPDAERCIICGEDLKHLITPDYAAYYFYQRGAQLAEAGEITLALLEVERGLRYQADTQLHLLAAILSKRAGNFVQMRQHVAAISVDDPLRSEAEWLLRSQQQRPESAGPGEPEAAIMEATLWPRSEEQSAPELIEPPPAASHSVRKFVGVVALLLVAVMTAWIGLGPGAQQLRAWLFTPQTAEANGQPASTPQLAQTPIAEPTATPTAAPPATLPALLPTLTPTATSAIPDNVAQSAPANEPVAAVDPQTAVQATGAPYDLKRYLLQSTQPELADLAVTATLQGVTLTLSGIVPMYILRQDLVTLAQSAPDVGALNTVDLLVRTPVSYTVVEGDNLWLISYKLYGEDRRAELLEANRATLLNPSLLRVGQELVVPSVN